MPRRAVLIAALLTLGLGAPLAASAQDASPLASPAAAACDAPALPPGTPTPMEEMAPPEATPTDDTAGMAQGSPEAVEAVEEVAETAEADPASATPAMVATPAGTPADPAAADEATAAAENLANCLNGGNAEGFVALLTPNFLLAVTGSANPYDALAGFGEIAPISVRSINNALAHGDGRLSVDVLHSGFLAFGPSQVNNNRLFFVEEGGYWRLDAAEALPVEGAAATIDVQLVDYAFVVSETSVPAGGLVAFDIVNTGAYPHEFAVVRLPEGVTLTQVLEDPSLEEQVAFLGANFAGPGGNASFALENLEAGIYTVVCFIDEPEGIPHVVRGMAAEFTVS